MRGTMGFKNGGKGVSPFPSVYSLPQDVHERVLLECLAEMGGGVERGVELVTAVEGEEGVQCVLRNVKSGEKEEVTASFVLGCDGAHSKVRQMAGIQMEGGTYAQRFFVADVELASGLPTGDNMNVNMSQRGFLMVFPFHFVGEKEEEGKEGVRKLEGKRARLLGFVPQHKLDSEGNLLEGEEGKLGFEDVRPAVENAAPQIQVESVRWFSSYRVHHRVAGAFRSKGTRKEKGGRMFVLGDAAHLHSPVGGQGMNTGLGDAANLAWKIALVWHGRAPATLLDTYEPERKAFAELLVATTDRFFTIVTNTGLIGWFARNVWMPYAFPIIMKLGGARMERMFFGRVSQTRVQYPQSKLSEAAETTGGRKVVGGNVKPGERLPWVEVSSTTNNNDDETADTKKSDGAEEEEAEARLRLGNYAPLRDGKWQVHVYGTVEKSLEQALYDRGVPLHVFPHTADAASKGLARDAVYVIRPDIYISFIGHAEDQMFLERFLEKWGIGIQN